MSVKKFSNVFNAFQIERCDDLCIDCKVCIGQCSYQVHYYDEVRQHVRHDNSQCVGCQRCAALCPTGALRVMVSASRVHFTGGWSDSHLRSILQSAEGKPCADSLFAQRDNSSFKSVYWDNLFLDAAFPAARKAHDKSSDMLSENAPVSFGLKKSLLLLPDLSRTLNPNVAGALKNVSESLGLSPSANEDGVWEIVGGASFEELLHNLRAARQDGQAALLAVNLPAGHRIAEKAVQAVDSGAEILLIDPCAGTGIPVEFAISQVDQALRDSDLRDSVRVVSGGIFRNPVDIFKAIILGADAVNLIDSALAALGCSMCGCCHTGKCPWGIATLDEQLCKRQNPKLAAERIANLMQSWIVSLGECLAGSGLSCLEDARGDRELLRGVGLSDGELKVLGIKRAGL